MKNYQEKITETRAISDTRYLGSICVKHPDLHGERRKRDSLCVACVAIKRQKHRSKPEIREKIYAKRRENREIGRVAADKEKKDFDRTRVEACTIAIHRVQDGSRWREFWVEAVQKFRESSS